MDVLELFLGIDRMRQWAVVWMEKKNAATIRMVRKEISETYHELMIYFGRSPNKSKIGFVAWSSMNYSLDMFG